MKPPIQWPATAALLLAMALSSAAWAADRGYFGFSFAIDGDGYFFNPTLKSVKIEKVTPNSPAAKVGIGVGDLIVEVEGHPVAGTKADVLKPYLQRDLGQSTRMLIKKPSGATVAVVLVAAPRGEGP